jgi:predicted nucleic acid-binding protein
MIGYWVLVRTAQIVTELAGKSGVRGNLVPDAYPAALAIESGSEWITADRGFARHSPITLPPPA